MSKRKECLKKSVLYFSCWEYRENKNSDYKIIMSVGNKNDMFKFPFENKFGYRNKKGEYIPFNESIITDMYSISSIMRDYDNSDYVGFSFLYGGKITNEIPSYWVGDNVKYLTKDLSTFQKSKKEYLESCFFKKDNYHIRFISKRLQNLHYDLEKYCQVTET